MPEAVLPPPSALCPPRTWRLAAGVLLVLGGLGGGVGVRAQDAVPGQSDAPGPQPGSVQRVEIAARQGSTELRRAASVAKQVYGREELDRFGDTSALDVLRRLPGVNVGTDGPRMRGLGAGYTQILINGDPAPPGFALDQLNPAQIERIEVLRAPTADQSAQAIAGTINIVLKDAPRRSQRDLRLGLNSGRERPQASASLTLGESKGPLAFSMPLSAFEWHRDNRVTTDRRMAGTDGQPAESRQIGRQLQWGNGYNLGPRLNWKNGDEQSLSLAAFVQQFNWNNRTEHDNRVILGLPVLDDDSAQNGMWRNARLNLTWAHRFREDQRIELKAGAQQSRWTFDARNLRQGLLQQQSVGGGEDASLTQAGKYSVLLGSAHSLTLGWDLEAREREEQRTTTDAAGRPVLAGLEGQPFDARVQRQAIYVQDEWELSPQWQLYLGLRHERITTDSRGAAVELRNRSAVTSPLLHLSYKLDPKGRDMVRASLTRSYKAPPLGSLLARPTVHPQYRDTGAANTALAPDRLGNAGLRPELATGLDIAFERYLANGGLWSVGLFHRRLTDVVRTLTTQQTVSWASVPRWVAQPVNFSAASTSGIEVELKGRAADLLPAVFAEVKALNLRASVNLYRSRVAALPGPDNRLDGQQPWSTTLGFDHRVTGLPLTVGGSFSLNPAYDTRESLAQWLERSGTRSLDLFGQWVFRPGLSLRVTAGAGVQPFGPSNGSTTTRQTGGDFSRVERYAKPNLGVSVDLRL